MDLDSVREIRGVQEVDECSSSTSTVNSAGGAGLSRSRTLNEKTLRFFQQTISTSGALGRRLLHLGQKKSRSPGPRGSTVMEAAVRQKGRPVSMYEATARPPRSESPSDKFMRDSTLLDALRQTEMKLLESERQREVLEYRIEGLEKRLKDVVQENDDLHARERAMSGLVSELESKLENEKAIGREANLVSRIREVELASELAVAAINLRGMETEGEELKVQRMMENQARLVEQTLPYTASVDNIYDCEDGLFDKSAFREYVQEQNETFGDPLNTANSSTNHKTEPITSVDNEDEVNIDQLIMRAPSI